MSLCCGGYIGRVYATKAYGETYFSLVFLPEYAPISQQPEE